MKQTQFPKAKHQAAISSSLQDAIEFHQRGLLDQAERCYNEICAKQPNHFDAKHLLGVLRSQQGRHKEAVELIRAALKVNPRSAPAWSNLGSVLAKLGCPEEALANFDKALVIRPDYSEALNNRGNALRDLKRPEEALASHNRALAIRPGIEMLGPDFDSGGDAFIDTAAAMSSFDVIITSDTAIAHLAGALGAPVWVALKWVPDWRWMLDRSDSPWYPSMTLYRQSARQVELAAILSR